MDPRWLTSAYDSKPKKNGVVKKKETAPSKRGSLPHYFSKAKKEEEPSSAEIVEEQTPMRPRPDDVLAKPMVTIPHNNQTGKWLTLFRARFNRDPTLEPHFSVSTSCLWPVAISVLIRYPQTDRVDEAPCRNLVCEGRQTAQIFLRRGQHDGCPCCHGHTSSEWRSPCHGKCQWAMHLLGPALTASALLHW